MIRDAATEAQVFAADPATSTWLSANAGSGKTRVLTDRVARLLLDGVDPQNILCLTYTKAAATEMQNRLFARLGVWAMMPTDELREKLAELGIDGPIAGDRLSAARTLFARAVETPGGLRIQTIHSFCAGVLRRFPLEAGVSPQFREMEDRTAKLLRDGIVEAMAQEEPDIVANVAAYLTDEGFDGLTEAILGERGAFAAVPDDGVVSAPFGIPPEETPKALAARTFLADDRDLLRDVAAACLTGSKTDVTLAETLAGLPEDLGLGSLSVLEKPFLYGAGAKVPFGAKIDAVPTKSVREAHDDLVDPLNDLMRRIEAAREVRLAIEARARTRALYRFAVPFLRRYEAAKLARGTLDFTDFIERTRALLADRDVAQWVLFKLDGGIDHLLVDEAQDTSPAQWDVIRSLASEFSSGIGARGERERTIFVVGDEKQSIYSFQGADPEGFERMRDHFSRELSGAGKALSVHDLRYSFRSSDAILRVVDQTFTDERREGLGADALSHIAFNDAMPGRVDLWPAIQTEKAEDAERDWTRPVDSPSPEHANLKLAGMIAGRIREMVDGEYLPTATGRRRITEGDFLILTRTRGGIFPEMISACKKAGLEVAGSDRLKVASELAVRDIVSVLRFLALPEDDLALAEALRSPLFGWSEQELYVLAQGRPEGALLWPALRDGGEYEPTRAILNDLLWQSDFLRPYDLIARLLIRHDGRARLTGRLGPEAEDGIDALLDQALGYEAAEIPSLTGFLEWARMDDLTVKRQAEAQGRRIRVMSIHGAKGLEAPIVILPDCHTKPETLKDTLYRHGDLAIWPPTKERMPRGILDLRDEMLARNLREQRRLLYVAMTRAESWLIACAAGKAEAGDAGWHDMIGNGLDHAGAVPHEFPTGRGLRHETGDWTAGEIEDRTQRDGTGDDDIATFAAVPAHDPVRAPLSPSNLGGAKVMPGEADPASRDIAMAQGSLTHLLLEHLPNVTAGERPDLARRLTATVPDLPDTDTLMADALSLVGMPTLATLFGGDAFAEIEVTADLPRLGRVAGTIDRLILTDDTVTAVDYKSNRIVPDMPDEVPEGLLRQMGAYDAILRAIWPGRTVATAILWTATGTLMPLPADLVADALARVTPP